ncbi:MAG: hypothetical protein JWN52_7217 [Actinomycetia bacterium]|nr:hypothetical protein [Actinomycetes bacterium]
MTSDSTKRPECPAWCTTGHEHYGHEGLLLEASGVAVTVDGSDTQPTTTLTVWDQTGSLAGAPGLRCLRLDADEARVFARVLCAVQPEDIIRFAHALAEGAKVVDGQGAEVAE